MRPRTITEYRLTRALARRTGQRDRALALFDEIATEDAALLQRELAAVRRERASDPRWHPAPHKAAGVWHPDHTGLTCDEYTADPANPPQLDVDATGPCVPAEFDHIHPPHIIGKRPSLVLLCEGVDRRPTAAEITAAARDIRLLQARLLDLVHRYDLADQPQGAAPEHPEDVCHRCGGPNVSWCAPSPLWNEVMRGGDINGRWQFGEIICLVCFVVLAERAGIARGWRLTPLQVLVPLQTVTPSGRTWNPETWLWEEPPARRRDDWVKDLDDAIAASGLQLVFDPRNWTAPHQVLGRKAADPDREHPAHVGQTCDEYDTARRTAGPGHCGLCGSEKCSGKPGEGCTPGPFETVEVAGNAEHRPYAGPLRWRVCAACVMPWPCPVEYARQSAAAEQVNAAGPSDVADGAS